MPKDLKKNMNNFEWMLTDSLKMLYKNVKPENVTQTIVHILLSKNSKLLEVNYISNVIENIYNCNNVVTTSYTKSTNTPKIILVASIIACE